MLGSNLSADTGERCSSGQGLAFCPEPMSYSYIAPESDKLMRCTTSIVGCAVKSVHTAHPYTNF